MMSRLIFISLLLIASGWAYADEQIISYHSVIQVNQDGSLLVTENIEVRAENHQIKRGIYRDFPTLYHDRLGTTTRVGFDLLSVKRDGQNENYHLQDRSNGVRIYIGSQSVILEPGNYSYQIQYRSTRQLGFFDNFDELYWNVTGNGWSFPIQQASATVLLPKAVNAGQITMTGYTGVQGSKQQFLTHHVADDNEFYFETTQPLEPYQGLTIVLDWPKGIVNEPDSQQRWQYFLQDNLHNVIAIGGVIIVCIYYLLIWLKLGKDPEQGVIMPLYQAPEGFSPASIRFISNMEYDDKCFAAALINLAVKGVINIDQDVKGKFVLSRNTQSSAELAPGEAVILNHLFEESDRITLTQAEHSRVIPTVREHSASLHSDYEQLYFRTNKKYFVPGILLSIATLVLSAINIVDAEIIFSTLFVGMFTLIPLIVIGTSIRRYLKQRRFMSLAQIAIQFVMLGIFFSFAGDVIRQAMDRIDLVAWPLLISAYLLVACNVLFEQWLKAPTLAGRKLLDKIEGFKLYLSVAEEDELKSSGKPEFSSDIYEKFLPFAIALGVENAWSRKLDSAIAAGLIQADYQLRGLSYHHQHEGFSSFSENLSSSMSEAISASTTTPGSSSGSSGSSGGSSGGGGGGGGGGGW